jgi:hypothetical protein
MQWSRHRRISGVRIRRDEERADFEVQVDLGEDDCGGSVTIVGNGRSPHARQRGRFDNSEVSPCLWRRGPSAGEDFS